MIHRLTMILLDKLNKLCHVSKLWITKIVLFGGCAILTIYKLINHICLIQI